MNYWQSKVQQAPTSMQRKYSAQKIAAELKENCIRYFIDVEHMQGRSLVMMLEAVESAEVLIA